MGWKSNAKSARFECQTTNQIHFFSKTAFLRFADEAEARQAFEKGRTANIGGVPFNIYYSRIQGWKR